MFQHSIDTIYVITERNLSKDRDGDEINKINEECQRLKTMDEIEVQPFKGVIDRFQWRVTASYYMCKFTIQVCTGNLNLIRYLFPGIEYREIMIMNNYKRFIPLFSGLCLCSRNIFQSLLSRHWNHLYRVSTEESCTFELGT